MDVKVREERYARNRLSTYLYALGSKVRLQLFNRKPGSNDLNPRVSCTLRTRDSHLLPIKNAKLEVNRKEILERARPRVILWPVFSKMSLEVTEVV